MTAQPTHNAAPIPAPTVINHQPVIGAIPVPAGSGEPCHQWIVMCHDSRERIGTDYTTWLIGCDAAEHRTFAAFYGNPGQSAAAAYTDLVTRAAQRWPAPPANTDTDIAADHGTDDTCAHCNGSGCPHVAAALTLTTRIQVRRAEGPARDTAAILWGLQDNIAQIDTFAVGTTSYAITHVDYDAPTAPTD